MVQRMQKLGLKKKKISHNDLIGTSKFIEIDRKIVKCTGWTRHVETTSKNIVSRWFLNKKKEKLQNVLNRMVISKFKWRKRSNLKGCAKFKKAGVPSLGLLIGLRVVPHERKELLRWTTSFVDVTHPKTNSINEYQNRLIGRGKGRIVYTFVNHFHQFKFISQPIRELARSCLALRQHSPPEMSRQPQYNQHLGGYHSQKRRMEKSPNLKSEDSSNKFYWFQWIDQQLRPSHNQNELGSYDSRVT